MTEWGGRGTQSVVYKFWPLGHPPHPPRDKKEGRDDGVGKGDPMRATGRKCSPTQSRRVTAGCPQPPACAPPLGRPVTAIPSVGNFVKNKADNFFVDKCRMANPVKRATVRPCSEKGTTGPVKSLTNQPTYDLALPCL